MSRTLLIIDMQNDYFAGGKMELEGIESAAHIAGRLLEIFRLKKLPVIHVQHMSINKGATFFIPQTEGARIHESVAPEKDEVVLVKNFPNSFRDTRLLAELQKQNTEEIIVCGAMSHMCIDTTVRAAFDLDLNCIVVADGCATRNLAYGDVIIEAAQVHGAFMASLGAVFARVTDLEGVEAMLEEKT